MRDVSHTHPFTDRGAMNRVFERGTRVVADGGEREAYDARGDDEETDDERGADERTGATRMKDIDHTPPYGEDVTRVFERGGREEPVEAEE